MPEPSPKVFLSAEWRNLALFNFAVPDELLRPHLPEGCELDRYEGSAFVSLVAFDFLQTRVLGVRWPGYVNFPEINLRFYIRRDGERGVCFVRELVPKRAIAWLARTLYNEPYRAVPMRSRTLGAKSPGLPSVSERERLVVEHEFEIEGARQSIRVDATRATHMPEPSSTAHFFKEHKLGVGRTRTGRRLEYAVHHPVWRVHEIGAFQVDVDFGTTYGAEWRFLGEATPNSAVLAEGSEITVSRWTV